MRTHPGLALILMIVVSATADADNPDPKVVGSLLVSNLLGRDYMLYGDEALHYAEAATAVGALRFAEITRSSDTIDELVDRYRLLLDDASQLVSRRPHVDMNVVGIVPLQIAMVTGDEAFLRQGLTFADQQWGEPTASGLTGQSRWWIDDLYMVGMLQMQAFRATGESTYADRAARQLAAYLPELQQDNGLFFHSPDVPIFWGRGNGWVASAMAEVLASLPADHPRQAVLLDDYRQMMDALLSYQGDDGLWRQVIDHEPAWPESSGSAMFAYAMAVGVNRGLLSAERFEPAIDRAWRGLVTMIDDDGNVADVCVGTGKKNDLQYYLDRPRVSGDLHGQAPLLWLAVEILEAGAID